MRTVLRFVARTIGVTFIALAVLQWLTFDYPDVNPFKIGGASIFNPGVLSQFLNWILVCVLGVIGWAFFTYGKFKLEKPDAQATKHHGS